MIRIKVDGKEIHNSVELHEALLKRHGIDSDTDRPTPRDISIPAEIYVSVHPRMLPTISFNALPDGKYSINWTRHYKTACFFASKIKGGIEGKNIAVFNKAQIEQFEIMAKKYYYAVRINY